MLDRIEITGFDINSNTNPPTVITKFRINRIPTAAEAIEPTSSEGIAAKI